MASNGKQEEEYDSSTTDDEEEEEKEVETVGTPSISSEESSVDEESGEESESSARSNVQGSLSRRSSQQIRKSEDRVARRTSQVSNGSKGGKLKVGAAHHRQSSSGKDHLPPNSSSQTSIKRKRQTRTPEVVVCDDSSEADFVVAPAVKRLKETSATSGKCRLDLSHPHESDSESADDSSDDKDMDTDDDENYEVEHILKHKLISETRKGKTYEYLIKWKNYAQLHNSWEPESNLRGAPKLLDAYWKKHENELAKVQVSKRKPGRPRRSDNSTSRVNVTADVSSPPSRFHVEDSDVEFVKSAVHAIPRVVEATPHRQYDQPSVRRRSTPPDESDEDDNSPLPRQAHCQAQADQEPALGEWGASVSTVIGLRGSFTSKDLHFCLQFRSGEERWVSSGEAYQKCPMAMLHFYESLLSLRYMDENGREVVVLRDGREQQR